MNVFEPTPLWPIWRVQRRNLKGRQHAWDSLAAIKSLCGMVEYDRLIWEMVPVGIPDKNRCCHCLKTIALIEREERELKERDYL